MAVHGGARVGLIEALGVLPIGKTLREARLAVAGDGSTPKTRADLSSLRQYRPRLALALWLGRKPLGRRVPVTNLFNYLQPPPELGWSVRVTNVRDFRGGDTTYDSHNGTDLAIPPGTAVCAAAPGQVLRVSSEFHRGGRKVFLDHGRGLVTTYNHLARPLVAPGQRVRRGERIAISGYSGIDAVIAFPWVPPHVHFNCWLNGRYVDPFAPAQSPAPSLWRRHNDPTPAAPADLQDDAFEPSSFDEAAISAAAAACRHPDSRREIEQAGTIAERAGAALMHLAYFPTRFDHARLGPAFTLYRETFERASRLDLPFSADDYDGIEIL